jgi:hypothetical protein
VTTTLDVNGAGDISGVLTLQNDVAMTKTGSATALTHSGTTGLAITSTSGYVDVESVRITGLNLGTASVPTVLTMADTGVTLVPNVATITHSGTTSLTIASAGFVSINGASGAYVDVESVRFTDANIGISGTTNLLQLATAGVTVGGTLDVTGADITMTNAAATLLHTHTTATNGLSIASTSGHVAISGASGKYVDVESVRFTDLQIGTATVAAVITMADASVTVAGATVTTTLDVNGAGDISGVLTLQNDVAMTKTGSATALTHSGTTGLAITSTSGFVAVESVRFAGLNLGTATAPTVLTLSDSGVTLAPNAATITHSGTTGLTITSTDAYVQVEDLKVTGGGEVLINYINRSTYQVKPFYLSSETVLPIK